MTTFTACTLPTAIRKLFEANHYSVKGPIQLHGAEIDLVAEPKADPFGAPIYIEATIEYVTNSKYGKDVGKLAMIAQIEPQARMLIVSEKGFSAPVKERARMTNIETLTYDDLFQKFEQFEPYITFSLGNTATASELRRLSEIYEEPNFSDQFGTDQATSYLTEWKNTDLETGHWLLVTGEYGTGKTALTKVLQYRWLNEYRKTPDLPLPLRIELREFASQFNARGLLHHFLDQNNLSHISVDFVFTLIRNGRAILILDGYDEMAQYLHSRERRSCLEALAQLSDGGAKGLITSRPNYFTEAEELQMYDVLYRSLEHGRYSHSVTATALLEQEKRVDELLEQFIERRERCLKDLSPEQTETLIARVLHDDPAGRNVVLRILNRIFRKSEDQDNIPLSGKPVIVSYLLEVVEGLKHGGANEGTDSLTEWQIYKLIVDELMLRDFRRSPEITPDRRRECLQRIAIFLSKKDNPIIEEKDLRDLVAKEFRNDLRRLSADAQSSRVETLFADVRSSATLTRGGMTEQYGWRFSHNTLREYLVAEALILGLADRQPISDSVTISDAMRLFASSTDEDSRRRLLDALAHIWKNGDRAQEKGQLLTLLWDGLLRLYPRDNGRRQVCLNTIAGTPPQMSDVTLSNIGISEETDAVSIPGADFSDCYFTNVSLFSANLMSTNFENSILEDVNFENADLKGASFASALIVDCKFVGANIENTDFSNVDENNLSILVEIERNSGIRSLTGIDALGYLNANGAITKVLRPIYILQFHSAFWVVDKILGNLAKQTLRQRRGLEQRGAAHQDVKLATEFVKYLEQSKLIETPKGRKELVEVTDHGRAVFGKYDADREFSVELLEFFNSRPAT